MAAFTFPNSPSNEQVVTNSETGTQYIYQASPGKWVVNSKNPENSFVELVGDTMTGALSIQPSAVASNGILSIKTSSNASNNYAFKVNNSSNQTFFQGAGDSSLKLIGKTTQVSPALNFFSPPGIAGFEILGPTVDNPSDIASVFNCYYNNDSSGTQIRYFGKVAENNDITNKVYVDTLVANANLLTGGTIAASGNSVNTSGSLSILQDNAVSGSGALYVKSNSVTTNITLNPSGEIEMKGNLSMMGSNVTKNIQIYGANDPTIRFRLGFDAANLVTYLSLSKTEMEVITKSKIVGNFEKIRGIDAHTDFIIKGAVASSPTDPDGSLLQVYRNSLANAALPDAVSYFGLTDNADNIQTKTSVSGLVTTSIASLKSSLHTAVNSSTDYASLKAALLAALA